MKYKNIYAFLILTFFYSIVSAEIEEMTPERVLELWKIEDNRSVIPDGFNSWVLAKEYRSSYTQISPKGEKKVFPNVKASEKIVLGKFLIFRVYPPAPIDIYGVTWFESDTKVYRKAVLFMGKDGTEAEGYIKMNHLIGLQYPNTDIYAWTQIDPNVSNERSLSMERRNKTKATWKELVYSEHGKLIQSIIGEAIPIK